MLVALEPAQVARIVWTPSLVGVLFSVLLAGEMLSARPVAGFALIFCSIVVSETKLAFLARPLREARS